MRFRSDCAVLKSNSNEVTNGTKRIYPEPGATALSNGAVLLWHLARRHTVRRASPHDFLTGQGTVDSIEDPFQLSMRSRTCLQHRCCRGSRRPGGSPSPIP